MMNHTLQVIYRWDWGGELRAVDAESPAAAAGLMMNDYIVRINGQNVSRSAAESVARLVRSAAVNHS